MLSCISGVVHFEHSAEVASARIYYCKLTLLSFVITEYDYANVLFLLRVCLSYHLADLACGLLLWCLNGGFSISFISIFNNWNSSGRKNWILDLYF